MNGQLPVAAVYQRHQPVNRELADALHLSRTCFSGRRKAKVYILSGLPFVLAGLLALLTALMIPFGVGLGAVAAGYFAVGTFSSVVVYKKLSRRKVAFLADVRRYLLTPEYIPCMSKPVPLHRAPRKRFPVPTTPRAPLVVSRPESSVMPAALARVSEPPANIRKMPSSSEVLGYCQAARPLRCGVVVASPASKCESLAAGGNCLPLPVAADVDCSAKRRPARLPTASPLMVNSSRLAAGLSVHSIKPVFSSAVTSLLPTRHNAALVLEHIRRCPEITAAPLDSVPTELVKGRRHHLSTPLRRHGNQEISKREGLSLIEPAPVPFRQRHTPVTGTTVTINSRQPSTPIRVHESGEIHNRQLPSLIESTSASVSTALAMPTSHALTQATGNSRSQRCLLVNVAFERQGCDIHLLFGRQALHSTASRVLKVEELAAPRALTNGSGSAHQLQLSFLPEGGAPASRFTITLGSEQLVALAGQLKSGTGRLIIDSKNLPALARSKYSFPWVGCQAAMADAAIRALAGSGASSPEVSQAGLMALPFGDSACSASSSMLGQMRAHIPKRFGSLTVMERSSHRTWTLPGRGRFSDTAPKLLPLHLPESDYFDADSGSSESTPCTSATSEGSKLALLPASSDNGSAVESIPPQMPLPASSQPRGAPHNRPVTQETVKSSMEQRNYTGFKRFASESDISGLSQNPGVDRLLLITPRLPRADDSGRFGSLHSVSSLASLTPDHELEADWELLEPFGQRLKQENQELELHEHLVHQLAYNLRGKSCVTLPNDQRCLVEKINGVPAGLNAYILVPETVPANGTTEIRLLFRGTKDRASVIRDLESSGAGFETMEVAAATITRQLHVILSAMNDSGRKINLTIGGHSLGGADAQNFLGHLLGAMVTEASEGRLSASLAAITHITLFTKCSAGVPKLAHERVCSALEYLQEQGDVRVKIFHLKVAGDVVQATGDCHIGAGLPFVTADVSVLQVYPADKASRIDRHTKKYFTDDTNLAPVYWYKWTQNRNDSGMAEISRSLHNTSAILRYNAVKAMQWALHFAAWFCTPNGTSSGETQSTPVVPTAATDSLPEISSEQEIREVYDQIIAMCLRLSNRSLDTPWHKIHPYNSSVPKSTTTFKPRYLKNMLFDAAFGAGAEFQNLVNQVNTHVLNIREPKVINGLLVKIGIGGELCNEPTVSFKGQHVKDALWPVTAHYCENFFAAAAKQHTAASCGRSQRKKGPLYTFELLLQLQAFNARYSTLERDVNQINFLAGADSTQRMAKLVALQERAASLQQEAGELYRQCKKHRLSDEKTAFILGQPVSCANGERLISQKVADFKKSIDKALVQVASC